ncbi:hypothetical protein N7454_007370 [Penicillium verhagenii]|nr:hypothetical protein N7454_007370 [Penicillium verhagenii]
MEFREATREVTLPLLRGGPITYKAALEEEENMLLYLDYPEQRIDFFTSIYSNREEIEKVASYHLGLGSDSCQFGEVNEWLHGSFNVCIPLYVGRKGQPREKRLLLGSLCRESAYPGDVDEKLRCEVATFVWLQENCPEVPIPRLWGFGLVGGQSFTTPQNIPLRSRITWYLKRYISWLFGYALPCNYVHHHRSVMLEDGHLVMDYIGNSEVQMLSSTWDKDRHLQDKRKNIFRGLSRVMLSLSRVSLPKIGSWTLDSNGVLQLSNRPLTLRLHQLENERIPTNISRNQTYQTADTYYLDQLSCHDSRIRHQPNSLIDEEDGKDQMARLTIMRALLSSFTNRDLRQGPFFFRLTDLHPSNIFVDNDWNIKHLIDLEWASSLPAETLRAPYWLTGLSVDNITDEHLEPFKGAFDEFLDIFQEEEKSFPPIGSSHSYRAGLMRKGFRTGNFWYFWALDSPKGLYNLFEQHINPLFTSTHDVSPDFPRVVSNYWSTDAEEVITSKLRDKKDYETTLCRRFESAASDS